MERSDKNRCRHHGSLAALNNLVKIKLTDTLRLPRDSSRAEEPAGRGALPCPPRRPARQGWVLRPAGLCSFLPSKQSLGTSVLGDGDIVPARDAALALPPSPCSAPSGSLRSASPLAIAAALQGSTAVALLTLEQPHTYKMMPEGFSTLEIPSRAAGDEELRQDLGAARCRMLLGAWQRAWHGESHPQLRPSVRNLHGSAFKSPEGNIWLPRVAASEAKKAEQKPKATAEIPGQ